MDSDCSNVICPVCTLYLRPGMTLKSHLGSHPKQKVIEALCRLSAVGGPSGKELVANKGCELVEYTEENGHGGGNGVVAQQWTQNAGPIGNTFAPIPGNHSIIYQQFLSSAAAAATTSPTSNHNHHLQLQLQQHSHQQHQPYVIFNSTQQQQHPTTAAAVQGAGHQQMAPYVFHQQQQLIMSSTSTGAGAGGHQLHLLAPNALGADNRLMAATVIGRNQHQQQLIALLPQIQSEKVVKTIFEVDMIEEDIIDEPDIATLETDGPTSVCVTVSTASDVSVTNQQLSPLLLEENHETEGEVALDLSSQELMEEDDMHEAEEAEDASAQTDMMDIKVHSIDIMDIKDHSIDIKCHSPNVIPIVQEEVEIENDFDSYTKGAESDNEFDDGGGECMSPKSESSEFLKIRCDLNNTSKETQTCSDMGTDVGDNSQPRGLNPPTTFFLSEENTSLNVECSEYITLQNSNAATEQGLYCNRMDTIEEKDEDGQSRSVVDMDGMNLVINNEFMQSQPMTTVDNYEYGKPDRCPTTTLAPTTTSTATAAAVNTLLLHCTTATSISNQSGVSSSPMPGATTNIRSDERLPPRGELSSGQESSSNASDVSAWVQLAQYRDEQDAPGLLGIYSSSARPHWTDSPDTSDCEDERARHHHHSHHHTTFHHHRNTPHHPQHFTITQPPPPLAPISISTTTTTTAATTTVLPVGGGGAPEPYGDEDLPTVSGYTAPPIQYKCPSCPRLFGCQRERRAHQRRVHSDSALVSPIALSNGDAATTETPACLDNLSETESAAATSTKKPVKKLLIKPRQFKLGPLKEVKAETNFDNVFTNKLKIEIEEDICILPPPPIQTTIDPHLKHELKPTSSTTTTTLLLPPPFTKPPPPLDDVKATAGPCCCLLCELTFPDMDRYREHLTLAHADITGALVAPATLPAVVAARHRCGTCGEVFGTEAKYTVHLKVHPLECRYCGRYFYRRANLLLHHKRHLGIKPHKCAVCDKSFLTKQKLDEHTNVHTGQNPIKCVTCGESFRRHSNLVQHRNKHHLNIKPKVKDYICECGQIFHSAKKLAWHAETHDKRPKACTQCSEKFVHAASLTRHMRRAHNDRFVPHKKRAEENVECPICKGVFLRASLDVHIKNHSGARPYTCAICNKDFTTKWNLKLHKWTHAARTTKPFKCDQCKGAFIRESDYIAHMNSHKALRPYTCNYCGAQFIRKYNCQRHVKEHEKGKTYTCEICNKSFHRSYYLKDHMRVHSGARPFSCHICGKGSTTKSNHNKHVRIHHAREPISTEN